MEIKKTNRNVKVCTCGKEFKQINSLQKYCSYMCLKMDTKQKKKNKLIVKNRPRKIKEDTKKLRTLADVMCQKYYVPLNPYCIVCGSTTNCMHHVVYKSQSSFLRYSESNLVPVCMGCHARHHIIGDANVINTIIKKKGQEWFDELQLLRRKECKLTKEYLEQIIQSYSKPTPF